MLKSVAVLVLDNLAMFEFGTVCEVFGIDRESDGVPNFDFRVCGPEAGRPLHTPVGVDVIPKYGLEGLKHADLVAVHVGTCDDPLAAYVLGATPGDVQAVLVAGRDAAVRDRTRLEQAQSRARDARTLLALPVRREGRATGAPA
jgi:hypothetical protein